MTYKLVIEGRHYKSKRTLPGLNDYVDACRRNRYAGGEMKRRYQNIINQYVKADLKKVHITRPVVLEYTYFEPDQKRDMDNIAAIAHKFVQDSLVECEIIRGDGWKHIKGFSDAFQIDKAHPRIEVLIKEV